MGRRVFNVSLVLAGAAGLLVKPHYRGPAEAIVQSYLGNLAASFAVFFIVASPPAMAGRPSWVAAVVALAVVQGFEVTNGFGVMTNTYDPWDLVANLAGVALAWAVALCWRRVAQPAPSARVGRR